MEVKQLRGGGGPETKQLVAAEQGAEATPPKLKPIQFGLGKFSGSPEQKAAPKPVLNAKLPWEKPPSRAS